MLSACWHGFLYYSLYQFTLDDALLAQAEELVCGQQLLTDGGVAMVASLPPFEAWRRPRGRPAPSARSRRAFRSAASARSWDDGDLGTGDGLLIEVGALNGYQVVVLPPDDVGRDADTTQLGRQPGIVHVGAPSEADSHFPGRLRPVRPVPASGRSRTFRPIPAPGWGRDRPDRESDRG